MTHDTWHVTRDKWHVTCYMWHVTCDRWQVKHDMWHATCDMRQVIHDMLHVTCDTWNMTCDMLWGVNILSKFHLPSSYFLWFTILWTSRGKGSLTDWMNDEAVCRTAPATPGLLIILTKILSLARYVTDSDISLKSKLTERIFLFYI